MTQDLVERCGRLEKRLQLVTFVALAGVAVGGVGIALAMRTPKAPDKIVLRDGTESMTLSASGIDIEKEDAKTLLAIGTMAIYNGDSLAYVSISAHEGHELSSLMLGSQVDGGLVELQATSDRDGHVGMSSVEARSGAVGDAYHAITMYGGNDAATDKEPLATRLEVRAGAEPRVWP